MVFETSEVHFVMEPWPQMLEVLHTVEHCRPLLVDTAKGHSSRHSLWDTVAVLIEPAAVTLAVNCSAAVGVHLSPEGTRLPFHSIEMDSTSSASPSWFILIDPVAQITLPLFTVDKVHERVDIGPTRPTSHYRIAGYHRQII